MSELNRDTDEAAFDFAKSLVESMNNNDSDQYKLVVSRWRRNLELAHYKRRMEHLESIINWLVNHPANKVVGESIGGGWSCDTYPDDDGTRREYFANNHEMAIEDAMDDPDGSASPEDDDSDEDDVILGYLSEQELER
jgi:hypothetical protein